MQIEKKTNIIETSGLGASGGFSIKTTAAAFQLLSSGLYTNKIRAVVRELSSNAVDAHTMVNNQSRPIEVKLPNNLDSQFHVKDFGPGLSHENIMHMYTTYFDSSKQASNDFIGGFGVGSKSPFAYTDSFTVESRHNGERRLYSAFIGEDNTPQIGQIGTFPMEEGEETGLTVSMPVKPNDFHAFEREAGDLFQWFDVKPTVLGSPRVIETPKMTEALPGVFWRESADYSANIIVRMGQVVYSIDKFRDVSEDPEVDRAMRGLRRFNVLLDVPIGTVSVAASREEVAYDKTTKEYLAKRLPEVYINAMQEMVLKLKSFDMEKFQERHAAYEFLQSYSLTEFVSEKAVDDLERAGRRVPDLNMILRAHDIKADQFLPILKGLEAPTAEQSKTAKAVMPYLKDKIDNWISNSNYNRWDATKYNQALTILEIDMPTNSVYADRARRAWMASGKGHASRTIAFFRPEGVDQAEYAKTRDAMLLNWGMTAVNVTPLSALLSPEDKVKYQKTLGQQSVPALTFFSQRPSACTSDLKSFYYVEENASGHTAPDGWDQRKFDKLVEEMQQSAAVSKSFLKDAGADQATLARVYSIKKEDMDKVKTFPGARNLLDVLKAGLENETFRTNWAALPVQREKKSISAAKLVNPGYYDASGAEMVTSFKKTQLGQAFTWLSTIPEWSYLDNEKRPEAVQYVVIGGLLSDASKTDNPLPGKFMNPDIVAERILSYYPMIPGVLRDNSYRMPEAIGKELIEYASWKDSNALAPFLPGVTTLPTPAVPIQEQSVTATPTL